jgi:hypothetical protein
VGGEENQGSPIPTHEVRFSSCFRHADLVLRRSWFITQKCECLPRTNKGKDKRNALSLAFLIRNIHVTGLMPLLYIS